MNVSYGNNLPKLALMIGSLFAAADRAWGQEGSSPEKAAPSRSSLALDVLKPSHHETTPHEAATLQSVYDSLGNPGKSALVALLSRSADNTKPNILRSQDSTGTTLLQQLALLTATPFHAQLEPARVDIIDTFVQELADPGELNQASWGVCGTGLLYPLFLEQPAEAARLVAILLSPSGSGQLADGSTLERAPYSLLPDRTPGRSTTERLLMSALMERANESLKYCTVCDSHFDPNTGAMPHNGLTHLQIATLYKAVFKDKKAWLENPGNSPAILMGELQKESVKSRFVPVSIRWSSIADIPKTFRHPATSQGDTHPEKQLLSASLSPVTQNAHHFILVTKVTPEAIYYRNLHGKSLHPAGTVLSNPLRKIEDPTQGIESMSPTEFGGRLAAVFVSR